MINQQYLEILESVYGRAINELMIANLRQRFIDAGATDVEIGFRGRLNMPVACIDGVWHTPFEPIEHEVHRDDGTIITI